MSPRLTRRPARPPALIVLHQEHSTPGRVGRLLLEKGVPLDIRRPRFGDPLPRTLKDHSGLVVFGGPMSANDPDEYIGQEIDLIGTALKEEAPFLGLCLGAQMLARQLGARVYAHAQGRAEIGYYPLAITQAGQHHARTVGRDWPAHVYQWHREGFDLPTGATLLAEGGDFPVQAIQVGPAAFGLQFHPEVTHAMIWRWTTRAHERMAMPGAQPREAHIEGWYRHDQAVAAWICAFLDAWLVKASADRFLKAAE